MQKVKKIHRQFIHWKNEEDEKLISLAIKYNKRKWKNIAAEMGTRDAKQCRERYFGHLDDGIDKHPFSKEEDDLIVKVKLIMDGQKLLSSLITHSKLKEQRIK